MFPEKCRSKLKEHFLEQRTDSTGFIGLYPIKEDWDIASSDIAKFMSEKINNSTVIFDLIKYYRYSRQKLAILQRFISMLIFYGANVDISPPHDDAPIVLAIKRDYMDILKVLLANGADSNLIGKRRQTPLISAIKSGDKESVEILLAAGADSNLMGRSGATPLAFAVDADHKEIVEILLAHGADIDFQDELGKTALIKAVGDGNAEMVKILLRHDALVDLISSNGSTASSIAGEHDYRNDIAELLDACKIRSDLYSYMIRRHQASSIDKVNKFIRSYKYKARFNIN